MLAYQSGFLLMSHSDPQNKMHVWTQQNQAANWPWESKLDKWFFFQIVWCGSSISMYFIAPHSMRELYIRINEHLHWFFPPDLFSNYQLEFAVERKQHLCDRDFKSLTFFSINPVEWPHISPFPSKCQVILVMKVRPRRVCFTKWMLASL